ncbi:MAG: TM2 domain-containing protein [Victivallaceae bacterium]|nr:TM2 domain-containing protein [Victivallaceae bacterium]
MFCPKCGAQLAEDGVFCSKCGANGNAVAAAVKPPKSRLAYALLGWFLGGWGIHNFYAGRTGYGIAQLVLTLSCIGIIVSEIWVAVELITVKADASGVEMSEQGSGAVVGLIAAILKLVGLAGLIIAFLCFSLFVGAAAMQ